MRDALQFASQTTFISTHPGHFVKDMSIYNCAQKKQSARSLARHFLSERFDPPFYKGKTRFLHGVSSRQLKSKNDYGEMRLLFDVVSEKYRCVGVLSKFRYRNRLFVVEKMAKNR